MAKTPTGKWDMKNWTKGEVSFIQAIGLGKYSSQVKFKQLTAQLPGEVASAQNTQGQQGGTVPTGKGNAGPGKGATYTQAQLQQLWIAAGGDPTKALIASAIAEAESSGRAGATNNNTNGTQDQGLWQVNSSHGLSNMFDPMANARAAVSISSNGTNWSPWTTFTSGAYQQFM
jgi:hypothetical protein